jgi:uncharacterized protein involved in type VI secretion and phage assembly
MHPEKELGLAIAIVSKRDDPEGLGRVKVRFPTQGDQESDWCPVAVPFGGTNPGAHGFFWVPEEGDTVVAGFDQGDPKSAIIIGSLYSKSRKPPVNDKDVRVLMTTKQHFIKIVEDPGRITIQTAGGQRVDIDDQTKTITVEGKETVTINGAKTVNVKASENVKVEASQNVDVTASQSATIKGTTSVTVDGGASVTVKGQSVTVDASNVSLGGSGASNPAILGTDFATLFATHTHVATGPGAPTSPPVQAAQVLQVLSKKVFLGG